MRKIDPEQKRKLKNDLILIGAALLMTGLVFLAFFLGKRPGAVLEVRVDNEVLYVLPLDQDTEKTVSSAYGTNEIVIRNGEAFVTEADCRDHICIRRGSVQYAGETIVCLPHKLVLTVRGTGGKP